MISPFLRAMAGVTTRDRFAPTLAVTRVDVAISDLPAALQGYLIAHVADLHVGEGQWRPLRAAEAAEILRRERPDLVVNTGDYLQGDPSMATVLNEARRFLLRPPPGVTGPVNLAVLGNHDYYAGARPTTALRAGLERTGVRVLDNEAVQVGRDGVTFTVLGLNEEEPGFERALDRLTSAPRPRVVLLHQPDAAQRLPEDSADLVLCGHTHGGQIVIPGLTGFIVKHFSGSHYESHRYRVNGNPVFISRGLGCTGLPFRWNASPELVFYRLVR